MTGEIRVPGLSTTTGWAAGVAAIAASAAAWAHDPIFAIGPHVVFKSGFEAASELVSEKQGTGKDRSLALQITYGLTGDWAVGVDLPYDFKESGDESSSGKGDIAVFTKYRFWRQDALGRQKSAAAFFKVVTDTANSNQSLVLDKGATDGILGLTYGYESRKWYHWASARYRINGTGDAGLDRGNRILIDFVGGVRRTPTGYLEPDTVWLLELNGEYGQRGKLNGTNLPDTGGTEWFISPGIFWTLRNFAIKAGVQIPIYHNLNGNQEKSDYRAKMTLEWHF